MQVNIKKLLEECGETETLYPGKRMVRKMPQGGENKSHCVIWDWRAPETLRLEVKAGLTGKDVPLKDLKKYPVSFQMPTYVEIDTSESEEGGEEESSSGGSSSGGGGGRKPARKTAFHAFSQVVEGRIPELGEIKKFVLMGKTIAKEAFASVLSILADQIRDMKVVPVNIMAAITNVKKVAPGGRPPEEIGRNLLDGREPYKPKDMFGVTAP